MNEFSVTPQVAGVAGEYYVATELSAHSCIASITLRNTKNIAILCSNESAKDLLETDQAWLDSPRKTGNKHVDLDPALAL